MCGYRITLEVLLDGPELFSDSLSEATFGLSHVQVVAISTDLNVNHIRESTSKVLVNSEYAAVRTQNV